MTDAERFEEFVRSYQDMVYGVAVRLLGNPAEAEDVSQSVFLKAFQRFDDIGTSASAGGWLKTVTRNACLNHLSRYRARWKFFSELGANRGDESGPEADLASPTSVALDLERQDEREQLEEALRTLPDHQRVPLVLFHFENMGYEAIAGLLGISLAKVKTDIHRGRHALKQRLAHLHAAR
jgi:RNA polymerase sigma-70 factor (ECF subfamily)